ncbi:MAG: hypothetical protein KAJ51_05400 [Thermoplasmata archaeon]|nr:hypothetical protein [Thermoplasmata archaeon]
MQYGDLEGQNNVYDSEGILIPLKDECVMATIDGYTKKVEKKIRLKWRIVFYDGGGVFILTDKRLVFIRDPIKYERPFKFSGGRFATLADWEYWTNRSNKAIEAGAKEFFEIGYEEITKVKNGKRFSKIIVKVEDTKFRFVVDANIGKMLVKLQEKDKSIQPLICFENYDDEAEDEGENGN